MMILTALRALIDKLLPTAFPLPHDVAQRRVRVLLVEIMDQLGALAEGASQTGVLNEQQAKELATIQTTLATLKTKVEAIPATIPPDAAVQDLPTSMGVISLLSNVVALLGQTNATVNKILVALRKHKIIAP